MSLPTPALLELQNIQVMRGGKVVLEDFNLRIHANEHIAILGPNGCGKSTLIKTITRECYPVVREGSCMSLLGREQWNIFELRTLLGIVSNDLMAWCNPEAVGLDVVLSGFFSSSHLFPNHLVKPEQRQLAEHVLTQLEVPHLADRQICAMSSGEARRILIARALVHKPRALLFDEPSNSLDFYAQHSLRQTMSLLANSGVGIILVTHDLADIVPEINRVVLMSKGRIVADGGKEEMLQKEPLSKLFGMKVAIGRKDGYYHLW
jgi:iron complex transport system ATP-binding protein